jgi:hypothetical protein
MISLCIGDFERASVLERALVEGQPRRQPAFHAADSPVVRGTTGNKPHQLCTEGAWERA